MKLKKFTAPTRIKISTLMFDCPEFVNLQELTLSYKKNLKILFMFLKQNKKVIAINAPQEFVDKVKSFKRLDCYKTSVLKERDVVGLLAGYDLILVFTTNACEEIFEDGDFLVKPFTIDERLVKEIVSSNKISLIVGVPPKEMVGNYSIKIPYFTFKKKVEYSFLLRTISNLLSR